MRATPFSRDIFSSGSGPMAAQGHGEMPQYLVDVDCFKFNNRIASLFNYLSDNVDVLEQVNHNLYKQGIISNEEREEVLKTPLGKEKASSLTKAIETALTRSPESLPTVIEELKKFEDLNDIIDSMTIPQVTDEGQYVYMYYNDNNNN